MAIKQKKSPWASIKKLSMSEKKSPVKKDNVILISLRLKMI